MGEYKTVCRLGELTEGEGKNVVLAGKVLAVFRSGNRVYAMDDFCPHMGASLVGGCIEDGHVTCPWHAWRFNLEHGGWTVNSKVRVPTYLVRVEGDEVQIAIPDPEVRSP